jgi:serine protease Do
MGVYTMDLGLYLDSPAAEDPEGEEGTEPVEGDGEGDEFSVEPPVIPKDVSEGVIVLESVGPALDAGLEFNDIIVALDNKAIESTLDLRKYLYNSKKIGESLKVTYYRDGKKKTIDLKLEEKIEEQDER